MTRSKRFKGRKGNAVVDGAFILAMIFTLVITVIILSNSVVKPINDEIQADTDFSAQAKQISATSANNITSVWDGAIIFILIMLWAGAIISSQFIDTVPAFFVFTVIGILIVMLVAITIEDNYEAMVSDPEYSTFPTEYPKVNFIMENIVITIMIIMFSIAVALYGKMS